MDAHQWLSSEERVLYVEAGALGGDGSAKKPLGSIAEALSGGDTSVVIMLAKGTHPAPEQIAGSERTIRLIGACPAETAITGPVKVNQGSIGLSALEIRAGLTVTEAKSVELHQLVIANPDGDGIAIDGSSLDKLDLWHSEVGETDVMESRVKWCWMVDHRWRRFRSDHGNGSRSSTLAAVSSGPSKHDRPLPVPVYEPSGAGL